MKRTLVRTTTVGLALAGSAVLLGARTASAHCDTLGGPVVAAARQALEARDITPVLKWVKLEQEPEVRVAFAKALAVRDKGAEARDLADTYFFETLVRVHRAGEGAPYTGLKPAGEVEPAVAIADKALESGSIEQLATAIGKHASDGVRQRFARALEAKKHANESVAAGREFVAAYVQFTHFVERLHQAAASDVAHGADAAGGAPAHQH